MALFFAGGGIHDDRRGVVGKKIEEDPVRGV
jgi:hypothetical protein